MGPKSSVFLGGCVYNMLVYLHVRARFNFRCFMFKLLLSEKSQHLKNGV